MPVLARCRGDSHSGGRPVFYLQAHQQISGLVHAWHQSADLDAVIAVAVDRALVTVTHAGDDGLIEPQVPSEVEIGKCNRKWR
jgi:hypothetical protein